MGISKITRNFQVTIPKDVREMYGLEEGDRVIFSIEGDTVNLIKVDRNIINDAAGIWETEKTGADYEDKVRDEWNQRQEKNSS